MSIGSIQLLICDGSNENCDASIENVKGWSIEKLAKWHDWVQVGNKHYCTACAKDENKNGDRIDMSYKEWCNSTDEPTENTPLCPTCAASEVSE